MEENFSPDIRFDAYKVKSETPKGVWIWVSEYYGKKKWVSLTSTKRYAYPTVEGALQGFIQRNRRCITILKSQLEMAEAYLKAAKEKASADGKGGVQS